MQIEMQIDIIRIIDFRPFSIKYFSQSRYRKYKDSFLENSVK